MHEFCSKCGHKLKDGDFCPNCGEKINRKNDSADDSYEYLIKDILLIQENGEYRISKAKLIGCVFFIVIVFGQILMDVPNSIRYGFLFYMFSICIIFISGLFYYSLCRGIGFIVRKVRNSY